MLNTRAVMLLIVPLLHFATGPTMGQIIRGPIINPTNGHEYYLLQQDTWTNCQAEAIALGGNLVTINDASEQGWLVNTFGPINSDFSINSFWIGLNDQLVEGNFVWESGEPVTYTNWFPGEPNGGVASNFVYVGRYSSGSWNDINDFGTGSGQPQPFGVVEVIPVPKIDEPEAPLCVGQSLVLNGVGFCPETISNQWKRETSTIQDGPTPWGSIISGTQTGTLVIDNIQPEDAGLYSLVAETDCGTFESNSVAVDVYCDCDDQLFAGGLDDNFALPAEVTSPSSDLERVLLQRRPGRPFHDFDQIPVVMPLAENDSRLAHSFVGLPQGIVGARLTMRVQAGGSGDSTLIAEGTDSVRLGFTTAVSTAASNDDRIWERRFGDLPGEPTGLFDAGEIWTRGDTRLFTLDLAALPLTARLGETDPDAISLIEQLNQNGFLDVTVLDETGVDFMLLEIETASGEVVPWVAGPFGEQSVFEDQRVEINVETGGVGGPFTYAWLKNGQLIDAVQNPSASTPTLVFDPALAGDTGVYTCMVVGENTCGSTVSSEFALTVIRPCELADIADDFGSLGADGQVSFGDFLALLGLIGPCAGGEPGCTGDLADDFGELGGDGFVDFGDFLALLGLIGPCP